MKRSTVIGSIASLIAVLSFSTPSTADTIEVTVCTFDVSDSAILNGSSVEIREGTNPVSSGLTGTDGCVTLTVEVSGTVGVDDDLPGFGSLRVEAAFPNPFEGFATIPFVNDVNQSITVAVFDLLGRKVAESGVSSLTPGRHVARVQGASLPKGVYVYRIAGENSVVGGQFVKLGASSSGSPTIAIERHAVAAKSSSARGSMVSVSITRLGYQTLELLSDVENGETVQIFLTKQEIFSDFGFTTTSLHVTFENQSTGADTFEWSFGDGSTSDEVNPAHLYSTEGDYSVSLVVSLAGAIDSTEKLVSVSATPGDNEKVPMDRTDLYNPGDSYFGEAYAWPNDPSPDPIGSVIVGTGYSNASQHFNTYDGQYQSQMNPEFINCGVGSNAIENWIGQNTETLFNDCIGEVEAAGYTAADVGLTINLIANQVLYPPFPDPGSGVEMLETQVQELGALLEQYFPNAINTYTTGEPAHWVEPSKCPRICEPIRFETAFGVNRALAQMDPDKHIHGAYLWSAVGVPNSSGETWVIEDFTAPTGDGYANQHPSDLGREKASRIYHAFFSEKYPTWYPKQ